MHGPRYVQNNPLLQKEREKIYNLHQKKLMMISSAYTKKQKQQDPIHKLHKIHQSKEKSHNFKIQQRTAQINKGNEILLGKLVEISNRKKNNPHSLKPTNPYRSLLSSNSGNVRSHNELNRRTYERDILRENTSLAKRILSKEPFLDTHKLKRQFQVHLMYKKNLMKINPSPLKKKESLMSNNRAVYKGRVGHVPPMNERSNRSAGQKNKTNQYELKQDENHHLLAPKALSMGNIHDQSQTGNVSQEPIQELKHDLKSEKTDTKQAPSTTKTPKSPERKQKSQEDEKPVSPAPQDKTEAQQVETPAQTDK